MHIWVYSVFHSLIYTFQRYIKWNHNVFDTTLKRERTTKTNEIDK